MNKERRKDIIVHLVYLLIIFFIYFILTKNKYIFGSVTDFQAQHYLFPEYFRNLFYHTKDLFPDFAFNLGGGQNIYYFSYYGLLSPIILLSYLFPMIKMIDYIIITNLLSVYISTSLFYFYLKRKYDFKTSFVCAFLFLCAGPLLFHAHRHMMFMNYMPFLILGLYGIDRFIEKDKPLLLIISLTLLIYTSYYYSFSSFACLFIYGIYSYFKKNYKIKDMFKLVIPFLISVMIGMLIILPTLYTLISGRSSSGSSISLLELFTPNQYLLYDSYNMGLTFINVIALIYFAFAKDKVNKVLALFLFGISIFPFFNYLLNGTLYINGKALIPFISLVLMMTSEFLDKIFKKEINIWQILLICYLLISSFLMCLSINKKDNLILKRDLNNLKYQNYYDDIKKITKNDQELFRINNQVLGRSSLNMVSNISEYKTTLYSSTSNKDYEYIYKELFNNPLSYRNKFVLNSSNNIVFQIFMNEKYVFTKSDLSSFYSLISKNNYYNIYLNDNTLPLGYASNNLISYKDFKNMSYPSNIISMLKNIVVPNDSRNIIRTKVEKISLDYDIISKDNLDIEKNDNGYNIKALGSENLTLRLKNDLKNKILFIRFTNDYISSCKDGDLSIKINGISNKLTCLEWKYYNENKVFDYTLLEPSNLEITFSKGTYKLRDIEFYVLDYSELKDIRLGVDPLIIDRDKTLGDKIVGNINVRDDGYFTMSIPYDKGFSIKLDNKVISYEKVNESFIGFPITKGEHHIEIEYVAPYKNISLVITIIGIIILIIYVRRKYEKNISNSILL